MGVKRSTNRRGTTRRALAIAGVLSLTAFLMPFAFGPPASAASFSGGLSPTIIGGGADLNGDGVVNSSDNSNAFYGDTAIIAGHLDCNNWGGTANAGTVGNGVIGGGDDCSLVGYNGTTFGVVILVVNGVFQMANGRLPTVFNAADPSDPSVVDADFAWSTIGGKVDSNGDGTIDGNDCSFGVVGSVNILGNPGANECGFGTAPSPADNGKVDLNGDSVIDSNDSCENGCFLGHNVTMGLVQRLTCPGYATDTRNAVVGTPWNDALTGTAGNDIICGLGGFDTLRGGDGRDLLIGGPGNDRLYGGTANDTLLGGPGRDLLYGGTGKDLLNGGLAADSCFGGPGVDIFLRCEVSHQ